MILEPTIKKSRRNSTPAAQRRLGLQKLGTYTFDSRFGGSNGQSHVLRKETAQ